MATTTNMIMEALKKKKKATPTSPGRTMPAMPAQPSKVMEGLKEKVKEFKASMPKEPQRGTIPFKRELQPAPLQRRPKRKVQFT
jgi:hypothetical protein